MPTNYDDYPVPRLNDAECEERGAFLNAALGGDGSRLPPIQEALSNARKNVPPLASLEIIVVDDERMGRATAIATAGKVEIKIGQSLAEAAIEDTDDARFALVHELVHVLYHSGDEQRYLIAGGNEKRNYLADHEASEWQADRIARAALMPMAMLQVHTTHQTLARAAGVALKHAFLRFDDLDAKKGKQVSATLHLDIARARASSADTLYEKARAKIEVQKLELWNKLPVIQDEPPLTYRKCGIYRIIWSEFGKPSECGWYIENAEIRSYFELKHG